MLQKDPTWLHELCNFFLFFCCCVCVCVCVCVCDCVKKAESQWNLIIKRSNITKPSYNKVILLVPALYIYLCFTLI